MTDGKFGSFGKVSIAYDLGEHLGIGCNLGHSYFGEGNGNLTYSLVLGFDINNKVGIYIEPYGEFLNFKKNIVNFDTGLTYLVNNNLQLDFSFGTGINQTMNYIAAGFSWLIEKE